LEYWLPVEPVWNSQGYKHINRNAHRSYEILLFFMFIGQPV